MEKEKDPSKVINPSTYMLPVVGSFDYVKLKQRLIDKKIITIVSLSNNPDNKAEIINDTLNLFNLYPALINKSEQVKFAEAFAEIKAKYDPIDDTLGLALRVDPKAPSKLRLQA